jgi:flagellum-specific peptidoglycan hydrolase FlgJ
MRTREYVPGVGEVTVDADFRRYGSPAESSADWWRLIQSGPRYAQVVQAPSLDVATDAMGGSGYATDPAYGRKLAGIKPTTPAQEQYLAQRRSELLAAGAPEHLAELGARQSALETGWGRSAPGGNYYGIKAPGNGKPQSLLQPPAAPPQAQFAPDPKEDTAMLGEDTLSSLMSNPLFLMGASILANNSGGRSTGEVIGRGLLGGTAAWQGMESRNEANAMRRMQMQQMQQAQQRATQQQQYLDQFVGGLPPEAQAAARLNPNAFIEAMTRAKGAASPNIAEYEYLRKLGVEHDQAMRYSFAGSAGFGERGMMMGNVPMVQVTNPDGSTSLRPMTEQELGYRRDVIGGEKRTASEAEGLGKQTADLREQINKASLTMPSLIKQTDQLIADIKAGKYQDTGPIKGRITEYWSPEIADLQFKATEQVLQNLQIVNLAPVTIKELELMGQLYAGAYKTPEQNLTILEYLNGRMKERAKRMRKLDAKLRSGAKIEDLPQWVESEFEPFDEVAPLPDFQAAPTVPVTVPQKPAGMDDAQWQELQRLRGVTGGR